MYELTLIGEVYTARSPRPLSIPKNEQQFQLFWDTLNNLFVWQVNLMTGFYNLYKLTYFKISYSIGVLDL